MYDKLNKSDQSDVKDRSILLVLIKHIGKLGVMFNQTLLYYICEEILLVNAGRRLKGAFMFSLDVIRL